MNNNVEPLVEIITPVFNGAEYLAECIESVISQTYGNWRYKIIDNQSTDETYKIAKKYADADNRIELISNEQHLPLIDNWNQAVSHLGADATYCKILHADDKLFRDCLAKMTNTATKYPSAGIISAYRIEEDRPSLGAGLPLGQNFLPGKDAGEQSLLYQLSAFGSPSNLLIRSDILRQMTPIYDAKYFHADKELCFRILKVSDFAFVFDVLTFTRRHNESQTSKVTLFSTYKLEDLRIMYQHGEYYFSESDYKKNKKKLLDNFYRFLGKAVFELKPQAFWTYQKEGLDLLGEPLNKWRLAKFAMMEMTDVRMTIKRILGKSV